MVLSAAILHNIIFTSLVFLPILFFLTHNATESNHPAFSRLISEEVHHIPTASCVTRLGNCGRTWLKMKMQNSLMYSCQRGLRERCSAVNDNATWAFITRSNHVIPSESLDECLSNSCSRWILFFLTLARQKQTISPFLHTRTALHLWIGFNWSPRQHFNQWGPGWVNWYQLWSHMGMQTGTRA